MAKQSTTRTGYPNMAWNPFSGAESNPLFFAASMQAKNMKTMLEWQIELLDFVRHRYTKDIAFIDKMLSTHESTEILSSFSGFCQEAVDDYSQEGVKITGLGTRLAADAFNQVQQHTEGVTKDMKAASSVPA
ncbi:hypothetical protein [Roseibium sp. RKSG952]|uniref:hypothetical protein n=1 Tax=Roseibium sp. RKSG952 TaxID=2529384 RepID=UPI0012BB87EA|nr:hypothetical protein [Roseibium sp. RKSG952]MTI00665.1 hypothetical protein [Roseibium sp. RKSG952]